MRCDRGGGEDGRGEAEARRGGEGEAKLHIAGQLFPALRSTVISSERLGVALEKVMVAACFADLAVRHWRRT